MPSLTVSSLSPPPPEQFLPPPDIQIPRIFQPSPPFASTNSLAPARGASPGSHHRKTQAKWRDPFGRLTTPRDVANVIYLLSLDEASWVNGEVVRVDGGEHISGATS